MLLLPPTVPATGPAALPDPPAPIDIIKFCPGVTVCPDAVTSPPAPPPPPVSLPPPPPPETIKYSNVLYSVGTTTV